MSPAASRPQSPRHVGGLYYGFAQTDEDVRDSLALRHRVFVRELGARADGSPGHESDAYDAFCLHILVRCARSHRLVASTRVLTHEAAIAAGGFYSAGEFDLTRLLARPGRFLEIGRTCVDPDFRSGAAITALWAGLGELLRGDHFDHLIGCASIDLRAGMAPAQALCQTLLARTGRSRSSDTGVRPYRELPVLPRHGAIPLRTPALIKAYLRLGAEVCGPPCHDPDFNVADLFMHLDLAGLSERYARRFLMRPARYASMASIPTAVSARD